MTEVWQKKKKGFVFFFFFFSNNGGKIGQVISSLILGLDRSVLFLGRKKA